MPRAISQIDEIMERFIDSFMCNYDIEWKDCQATLLGRAKDRDFMVRVSHPGNMTTYVLLKDVTSNGIGSYEFVGSNSPMIFDKLSPAPIPAGRQVFDVTVRVEFPEPNGGRDEAFVEHDEEYAVRFIERQFELNPDTKVRHSAIQSIKAVRIV